MTEADLLAILYRFFDGADLQDKSTQAANLLTTTSDGWPHAAMISVGELVVRPDRTLGLATWSLSRTTANVKRTRHALLYAILEGHAIRGRLQLRPEQDDGTLSLFSGEMLAIEEDVAAYATLTSAATFALRDVESVLERWGVTVARLQAQ